MSEYFLKLPGDSQPRAYSEYEVREFLGQGVIDSKTLTWKQGMEGWQPVDQVLPPMSPVWEETQNQESKDQPEEQQYRLRYSLNGLAKLSILACFVLLPFMLWSSWLVFSNHVVNYEEIQTLIQQNMVHLPSFAAPLVFLLSILFIPSLLIQLIWLYRASANIQEFQVPGIRFTPFLSVLLSCMPVVGMVLNALVLQEIYKASKKPAEWMQQTPSRSLRLYLLVTTALTLCTLFPFGAEHYVTAFLLTGALMTAASILWLICVLQITRKQEELVSKNQNSRS